MHSFEFTPIRREHFPLLSYWLATPHVARWWDDDPSLDAIERDYGGCLDGSEPCEVFIAHCADAAVGLVQRYRFGAYPQYASEVAHMLHVPADISSIDYLIGPTHVLGEGLGTAMIAAFVARTWEDDPLTPAIIVPVHVDNRASCARWSGRGSHASPKVSWNPTIQSTAGRTLSTGLDGTACIEIAPLKACSELLGFVAKCISCKRTHQFIMREGNSL